VALTNRHIYYITTFVVVVLYWDFGLVDNETASMSNGYYRKKETEVSLDRCGSV